MAAGIRTADPFRRLAVVIASEGAYVLAFAVLYPLIGASTTALIIVPVGLAGWLLGVPGSLLFGVLSVPMNIVLFTRVGGIAPSASLVVSIFASILFTLIGLAAAWIRTLLDRVNDQAQELQEEHRILEDEMEKRIALEERLIHQALHDPLTDLPNRRLFLDRLRHAFEWNRRHPETLFAVVYLDFDRFKDVNDTLGHDAGDRLLVEIAGRLKVSVRATDTVARMGGDEFVILLEGIRNESETLTIVRRIQDKLSAPFGVLSVSGSVDVTASLGVAMSTAKYDRLEDIIRDADTAMYSAKAGGKDGCEVFEVPMRAGEDGRQPEGGRAQALPGRPRKFETRMRLDQP